MDFQPEGHRFAWSSLKLPDTPIEKVRMPLASRKLTALQLASFKTPGTYADVGGLHLEITPDLSSHWIFKSSAAAEAIEIKIGTVRTISLTAARRIASEMRFAVASGQDPQIVISAQEAPDETTTFGAFARSYISSAAGSWKTAHHELEWRNSMRTDASTLLGMPIATIGADAVVAVLQPIWLRKPQRARRLLQKIEKILNAAEVSGLRPACNNPAAWGTALVSRLPPLSAPPRKHHAALPWQEVRHFMTELRLRQGIAARCLEFSILTAARSEECLGATWAEIDFKARVWTIPAVRRSAGAVHSVTLSQSAFRLLHELGTTTAPSSAYVFARDGVSLSARAMTMLLQRMKRRDVTPYGFRETFRNWAQENTTYSSDVVDRALGLATTTSRRSCNGRKSMPDHVQELLEEWGVFLSTVTGSA